MWQKPKFENLPYSADIYQFPKHIISYEQAPSEKTQIFIGNTYGNALGLLHWLITAGVLTMPEDKYAQFAEIYRRCESKALLLELDKIVITTEVKRKLLISFTLTLSNEELIAVLKSKQEQLRALIKTLKTDKKQKNPKKKQALLTKAELIETIIGKLNHQNNEDLDKEIAELIPLEEMIALLPDEQIKAKLPDTLIAEVLTGRVHDSTTKNIINCLIEEKFSQQLGQQSLSELIDKKILDSITQHSKKVDELFKDITVTAKPLCRIKGGEVASLGVRDDWTLRLIKLLHDNRVPYEIEISKGGLRLLDYERGLGNLKNRDSTDSKVSPNFYFEGETVSLKNLDFLIYHKLVVQEDFFKLINECYKPNLKAFTYTYIYNQTFIFSAHGFVGLEAVSWFADYYKLKYEPSNIQDLMLMIDIINHKCKCEFMDNDSLLISKILEKTDFTLKIIKDTPLQYVTCFQDNTADGRVSTMLFMDDDFRKSQHIISIPNKLFGHEVIYMYGQDGFVRGKNKKGSPLPENKNIINLNGYFCMPMRCFAQEQKYIENQRPIHEGYHDASLDIADWQKFIIIRSNGVGESMILSGISKDLLGLGEKFKSSATFRSWIDKSSSAQMKKSMDTKKALEIGLAKLNLARKILENFENKRSTEIDQNEIILLTGEGELEQIVKEVAVITGNSITFKSEKNDEFVKKLTSYIGSRQRAIEKKSNFEEDPEKIVFDKISNFILNRFHLPIEKVFSGTDIAIIKNSKVLTAFVTRYTIFFGGIFTKSNETKDLAEASSHP